MNSNISVMAHTIELSLRAYSLEEIEIPSEIKTENQFSEWIYSFNKATSTQKK